MISAELMRLLLGITAVGMALLGALYLRQRRLTAAAYLGWGLLLLSLPWLGPFLVILLQPGRSRRQSPAAPRPQGLFLR